MTLPIEDGSIAAQARYHLWVGAPAVVVASPPGAGKTTLITQVVTSMVAEGDFTIAIATPNRAQSFMLANRFASAIPGKIAVLASGRDKSSSGTLRIPRELTAGVIFAENANRAREAGARVIIANARKWWHTPLDSMTGGQFDILVLDEAYQITWGDFTVLAGLAPQYLLVGDPGQIPPIVSCSTHQWEGLRGAPHTPAPIALTALHSDDVTALQLPATHRCGPETTKILQGLYPFRFASARTQRSLTTVDGTALPEISRIVVDAASPADARLLDAAATAARDFVGATVTTPTASHVLGQTDVAVIVAHVHQAVGVRARLGAEYADIAVLTVDQAQGSEWAATVVIDPASGHVGVIPDHNADPGRLCVALSRSNTHTHWIEASHVIAGLEALDTPAGVRGAEIRRSLAA